MLQLQSITKDYKAGDTIVHALKGVDISFRKSEFVSVLGPSGCGKTTLLNIIGGLDHYTSGELFIDGISTKGYNDRDWDTYRNNRIGFIFQSYNLIPHQTISENVELALSISGVDKAERVRRAHEALDKVGLKDQYNKKPNQLSGGQCQRVAIARALVNDPEILLADEPTGALDTNTSVQIMDLIQEIAKQCLVIMVTHNPDLAEKYSTRIIRLLDGEVVDDTDPFDGKVQESEEKAEEREVQTEADNEASDEVSPDDGKKGKKRKEKKSKLSFWSAFRLSARNLMSKFKRTLLVCFAGSIGIIGVATVLAVSSGVQNYIHSMQDDMLSGNPVSISSEALDLGSFMSSADMGMQMGAIKASVEDGKINIDKMIEFLVERNKDMGNMMIQNDIKQEYVDFVKEMPKEYYAAIATFYGINLSNNLYTDYVYDDGVKTMSISAATQTYMSMLAKTDYAEFASYLPLVSSQFRQTPGDSGFILSQYDILAGDKVATEADEIMIVVSSDTELADLMLAQFGYYTQEQFFNEVFRAVGSDDYDEEKQKEDFTYDELLNKTYTWYPNKDVFKPNADFRNPGVPFTYNPYKDDAWTDGKTLKITSILRPKADISYGCLRSGFYYTPALAEEILKSGANSDVVKFLNGDSDLAKAFNGTYPGGYIQYNNQSFKAGITYEYTYSFENETHTEEAFLGTKSSMNAMLGTVMPGMQDFYPLSKRELGGESVPSDIYIYPTDFDYKDEVTAYLDKWNADGAITVGGETIEKDDRAKITYTDNLAIIISMVNTMINIVTSALIAFTALSLVVSTVMIAIITYVSVIERVKEIGVIRSLGGRKRDVSALFNAETFIIGGISGVLGIAVTYAISGILNLVIGTLFGIYTIAALPYYYALLMIAVSIVLTLISGLIPASLAAKKDPVEALRSE